MTKVTLASLIEVGLSPRSLFNLALGVNVGSAVWVTTIGGLIMYKNMPRPSFGKIQEKLLPAYFKMTTGLSALMLGIHLKLGSSLHRSCHGCSDSTYVLRYLLASMTISSLVNLCYVGPKTTEIMNARHELEAVEKKSYDDQDASDQMKLLNKQFSKIHGLSSGLNLIGFLVPSIFLGLWTGEYGLF
ncbi:uncharacterized protein PGTG_22143 [Puccinia graminis f. sp. tritici CRL 75-36-700-3]|uniref:TMEM205-like domain-containing protein n=1 Tax=Puccinia graminis f. sp. tritici (strain CRL 75-36-700-3 / race SCCL) TaxID=418459 RepID=H6QTP7_PUCGT|nr:uncharacterized protein PGTG_22143 [Puccinia graminis f. sp. tritici CRL 75-36-700-3]EHS64262.1 hypothetical protein PGTG_22143 [Puccinia graminis f. sp. tritici CRL 75-36-700-3]